MLEIPSQILPDQKTNEIKTKDYLALDGNWVLLVEESDCIQSILKGLGVTLMRRIALRRHQTQTHISVTEKSGELPEWHFVTYLPLYTVKESRFLANGEPFIQDDSEDTGIWSTTACFSNGCLKQIRTNEKGTQIDARSVFNEVPSFLTGKVRGPVMKFEWSFEPSNGGELLKAVQWLEKMEIDESVTDTTRSTVSSSNQGSTSTP
eukprot:GHVP01021467.1.p1 GENE.GHVP01021467.1~~GHVP01021467.1.p1  ORF type:complete len:206 (+),score=37.42 GHVP01021467.1:1090-1707(+)